MRKFFWSLLGMLALSVGSAQTPGVGFYTGTLTYLGLQYQSDNLRLGAGLGYFGIAGDAALILAKTSLSGNSSVGVSWYYGFGVGATISASGLMFAVYPHGLVGMEIQLPDPAINPYFEGNLGAVVFIPSPIFGPIPSPSVRLGVIVR